MKRFTANGAVHLLRYRDAANPTAEEVGRRSRFLAKFPNQNVNILKFQDNPGCSCASDLAYVFESGCKDPAIMTEIVGEPAELLVPKPVAGRSVVVGSDTEWKDLLRRIQEDVWQFRGMLMTPNQIGPDGTVISNRVWFY